MNQPQHSSLRTTYPLGTYRAGDHQPVIPIDAPHDACSHIHAQPEDHNTDAQGEDLDDDKGGAPSLWVDVVWGRP